MSIDYHSFKERNKKISKARSKTVLQYDKQSHFIKEWESASVIKKKF